MSIRKEFNFKTNEIHAYLKEDVAVINIKSNVFDTLTDLAESGKLISLIQSVERIPDIKALIILNQPGSMNEEQYDKFLHRILKQRIDPFDPEANGGVIQRVDRVREINILNRTITHLMDFKKISIMGLQGNIVTPFIGASLSVDFRYVADNVTFSLAHLKYGLHPSGALPFFLTRSIGHSKAMEVLFNCEPIAAQKALDLGLVTKVLPAEDFENHCMKEIEKICHLDTRVIHSTKLLANISRSELRHYFDMESALLH